MIARPYMFIATRTVQKKAKSKWAKVVYTGGGMKDSRK